MSGYWLNKAFYELREPQARERWRADLGAYLEDFPLTDGERHLVMARDWGGCVDAGASIYTLTKVGATTGESLLEMGARMRGETMEQFRAFLDHQNERNWVHRISLAPASPDG
ncbi:MAG: hypothetical protein ACRDVP_03215 [Acidimicrobiales bacterium]